ncbi:MAG: integrase core domain-containing protein [Candidatus Saccharimonadales bacterium]
MKKHLTKKQVLAYRKRVLVDASECGVTTIARRYGIYRSTIYRWRQEIMPQKPGPRSTVYWQTDSDIEELVLQIRLSTNYGPRRIKDELSDLSITVGEKAIRGIVERADLVRHQRKPKKKARQPFYAPYPGYRLQVDTKAVPNGGDERRSHRQQFTAIDIVSKIRYLSVKDGLSNGNSVAFVRDALVFYGEIGIKIECVQTDNHATFTNLYVGDKAKRLKNQKIHPLTSYLTSRGIEHKLSRPGTPQHNGFVERSHRTDEEEFYDVTPTASLSFETIQAKMKDWQDEYNLTRRHSSCNNLPPIEYFNTVWIERLGYAEVS